MEPLKGSNPQLQNMRIGLVNHLDERGPNENPRDNGAVPGAVSREELRPVVCQGSRRLTGMADYLMNSISW